MSRLHNLFDVDRDRPSSAPPPDSDKLFLTDYQQRSHPFQPKHDMFVASREVYCYSIRRKNPFGLQLQNGGTQRTRRPRLTDDHFNPFDGNSGDCHIYDTPRSSIRPNLGVPQLPHCQTEPLLIYNTKLSRDVVQFVKGLFNHTWLHGDNMGRDAVGLHHSGLHVKLIKEVNNIPLLQTYEQKLSRMPAISLPHLPYSIRTTNFRRRYGQIMGIDPQKEVLLFHGTKLENIDKIVEEGFSLRHAKDGLYDRNIYFTDCCQKADQYSDDKRNRSNGQHLAMILARVALGSTRKYSAMSGVRCDSQIGGTALDDTKRFYEFMLSDADQCYPAYVITYKRI